VAVDRKGKTIREFRGNSGAGHMKNFVDAVRAHDPKQLAAPVEIGHSSAGWAHALNAACRAGSHLDLAPHGYSIDDVDGYDRLQPLVAAHLKAHGISDSAFRSSGLFSIDDEREEFSGDGAEQANTYLGRPNYRGEFAIPG
jgi:hypothetical protein